MVVYISVKHGKGHGYASIKQVKYFPNKIVGSHFDPNFGPTKPKMITCSHESYYLLENLWHWYFAWSYHNFKKLSQKCLYIFIEYFNPDFDPKFCPNFFWSKIFCLKKNTEIVQKVIICIFSQISIPVLAPKPHPFFIFIGINKDCLNYLFCLINFCPCEYVMKKVY